MYSLLSALIYLTKQKSRTDFRPLNELGREALELIARKHHHDCITISHAVI